MSRSPLEINVERTRHDMVDARRIHNLGQVIQDIETAKKSDPQHFVDYLSHVNALLRERKLLPDCIIVGTENHRLAVMNRSTHKREDITGEMSRIIVDKTQHGRNTHEITYDEYTNVPNVADKVGKPNLAESKGFVTSVADQILADEKDPYNCHFYTGTFLLGHEPHGPLGFPAPKDLLWFQEESCKKFGYHTSIVITPAQFLSESSKLKDGDIVVVVDPKKQHARREVHSAIVIRSEDEGGLIIRQKFDQTYPVVDLTAEQFRKAYFYDSQEQVEIWNK
jgi:hypothetical protein